MNVNVSARPQGGVNIRSTEGVLLAGNGAATLTYNASSTTPRLRHRHDLGLRQSAADHACEPGEIRGLLDLRNTQLHQPLL